MASKINEEEFNNFMMRVNEVTKIVNNLSSNDAEKNAIGSLQADDYLKYNPQFDTTEFGDGEKIVTKTKFNKSVINKNAFLKNNEDLSNNQSQMSVEAWKRSMEIDAAQRANSRKIRQEKSETLKTRGDRAFRQGDLNKALTCYNQAIDLIRDNPILYTSRALIHIYLKLYDRVETDCKWALKLNENAFRPQLYLIKCLIYKNDKKYEQLIEDVKRKYPKRCAQIDEYVKDTKAQFASEVKSSQDKDIAEN